MSVGRVKDRMAALVWLSNRGHKVSKSKLYRDAGKAPGEVGALVVQSDGSVLVRDLKVYAGQLGGPVRDAVVVDPDEPSLADGVVGDNDSARRFMDAKAREKLADAELKEMKLEQARGNLLRKDLLYVELAARGGVLESMLKSAVQKKVRELVHLVGGKPDRATDLLQEINATIDRALDEYARTDNFDVVFEGEA